MMNKKKVLFVSESHHLASGFGTYAKEVISRLHATGKYHIAEFASYGHHNHTKDVPWDYYGNLPEPSNSAENEQYNATSLNHFGFWRFSHVLLDFKPDIILTYRDPWMDQWIGDSATRPRELVLYDPSDVEVITANGYIEYMIGDQKINLKDNLLK